MQVTVVMYTWNLFVLCFGGWFSPKEGLFFQSKQGLGGGSNIFYFHLYLGKWSNLTSIFFHIFSRGWLNHQLEGPHLGSRHVCPLFQASIQWATWTCQKPYNLVLNSTGRVPVYPYCWWQPEIPLSANQLRLVVYPIMYRVLAPSQVVVGDFWTINSMSSILNLQCFFSQENSQTRDPVQVQSWCWHDWVATLWKLLRYVQTSLWLTFLILFFS